MHQASVVGSSMRMLTPLSRYSHTVHPSSHDRSTALVKEDHVRTPATSLNLAIPKDTWYRAAQGLYVFSRTDNNERHLGDEVDIIWTHFSMDGQLSFQADYAHMWPGSHIPRNLGRSGKIGPMHNSGSMSNQHFRIRLFSDRG